jgi:deferrochelatase/peroxidase EfeB
MKTPLNFEERLDEVWKHCQRGLVYPSPFAIFTTFWLNKSADKSLDRAHLAQLMASFRKVINTNAALKNKNTSVVLGVSFRNWAIIFLE